MLFWAQSGVHRSDFILSEWCGRFDREFRDTLTSGDERFCLARREPMGHLIGVSNRLLDSRDRLVFGDQTFDYNHEEDIYICCNVDINANGDTDNDDNDNDIEASSLLIATDSETVVVAPAKPWNRRNSYKNNYNSSIEKRKRTPLVLTAEEITKLRSSCLDIVLEVLQSLGLRSFCNAPVLHCYQSYAVAMEVQAGYKIVYSGDTRPCPTLIEISTGATVLIHESTFEDEKLDEAQKKLHSTIGEALTSGATVGAYRVILTHFSQRYPNLPKLPDRAEMKNAVLAFDYMSFALRDLEWLPALTPILEEHFPPQYDNNTNTTMDVLAKEENNIFLNRKCTCCPISLDFCALVSSAASIGLIENGQDSSSSSNSSNGSKGGDGNISPNQKRKRQLQLPSNA